MHDASIESNSALSRGRSGMYPFPMSAAGATRLARGSSLFLALKTIGCSVASSWRLKRTRLVAQ